MNSHVISPSRPQLMFLMILLIALFLTAMLSAAPSLAAGIAPQPTTSKSATGNKADDCFKKGVEFQNQKKFREAAEYYEKAIALDDGFAEAYSNLGYAYRKQEIFDRAIDNYKKAIHLKPDLAEAHEYIGEAYAEMGQFERAEEHLAILKKLHSDEAEELKQFIDRQKTLP